jgi:hypothetical protein
MKRTLFILAASAVAALLASTAAAAAEPVMTDAEADAGAVVACMERGKDAQAQTACILGMVAIKAIASRPAAGASSSSPPPAQVVVQSRHWVTEAIGAFFGVLKDTIAIAGPTVAQVMVAKNNGRTQERLAEFASAERIATSQAFVTMGGQVRDAGVAGYPYVQAPGAITTTTTTTSNTLSGTGALVNGAGAATYTGPRTCTGGAAAGPIGAPGPGTGFGGVPGGAATC